MSALHSPSPTTLSKTAIARKLVRLERTGRYEEALEFFGDNFADENFLPDSKGLSAEEAAESLLRFGVLIGFYAFKNQTEGGQERSKDIVTAALHQFEELGHMSKVAECQNYLALGYWRNAELQEASVWVNEALACDLSRSDDARLYAYITKSLVLLSAKKYEENVEHCLGVEDDVRTFGDAFLNGSLCTNVGLSFKNLGMIAEATRYLTLARIYHEKSRHKIYLGTVNNNLAQIYKEQSRFTEAHESVNAAIKLYSQLRDRNREGSSIDTKAQIYFVECDLANALAAADRSIFILKKGGDSAFLPESLLTRAKVLLYLDRFTDAVFSLFEAVSIVRVQTSEGAARDYIEEFKVALLQKVSPPPETQSIEQGELELVLPPSLGKYPDYKGIWINSSYLERFGINKGSLAIVVSETLKRGDLAAISEVGSDNVICGVYDAEFGIVCLVRDEDHPQLYNEDDITVIGKIIGVCSKGRGADGKMIVEPIAI
jgi:tetratricopeptide (TPR) repeat protein